MLWIMKKSMLARNSMFFNAPVNFDVISNVRHNASIVAY